MSYNIDTNLNNAKFNVVVESAASMKNPTNFYELDLSEVANHVHIFRFHPQIILKSDFSKKVDLAEQIEEVCNSQMYHRIQMWFPWENRGVLTNVLAGDYRDETTNFDTRQIYQVKIEIVINNEIMQIYRFIGHLVDCIELTNPEKENEPFIVVVFNSHELEIKDNEAMKEKYYQEKVKQELTKYEGAIQ